MHSGVVSGVPVMFERPANRLSGFKEQEGGALSPQNQVSDQVESRVLFLQSHRFRPICCLAGMRSVDINHYSGGCGFGHFRLKKEVSN